MLPSKPSGGDLAVEGVPDGHDGLCVLSEAYALILISQKGAGGLVPQAIPVPLEMAGR